MATIRLATADDAAALNEISKQYFDTPITLAYEVPSLAESIAKIDAISRSYPFLVVEDNKNVVGFAYAHRNLEQPAMSWNAELRAFIDLNQRGHGYGFVMMEVLIDILRLQGVYNVYSSVTEGNPRSESLHRKLGFDKTGVMHKTGYKNGRWLDVHLLERRILEVDGEPSPFIPLRRIDHEKVQEIICAANQRLAARA